MKNNIKFITVIVSLILSVQVSFGQDFIPKKPKFIPAVVDSVGLLSASQKAGLEHKLEVYSDSTSTEVFLMIVKDTRGEEIKYYAAQLGYKWGIGQKGLDNGIIILLAEGDRKIAIETGYGIEHKLTDALSRRIIENEIIPEFKNGDYFGGLDKGTDAIFEVLNGTYKKNNTKENESGFPFILIVIIIFILIIIFSRKNRGNGGSGGRGFRRNTATDILETIILSGAGRSSGGGFGSGGFGGGSSGGFGGFGGGGSFGGGGASGSW
ncbi:uncharacterized protein SAMN05444411_101613 [Lutibacter oricola]|uniref:TPM domain-containing protein n=1 Tax=Lutibacter oricola TaxID=762486 RepID=A0A1H2T3A2_9FLAO|nr:TPM domain-containing protein [Lutibacter oricola]SDW38423.1 uncharacterized protein SAMN05444411_101613 [Lutibacter oricola]